MGAIEPERAGRRGHPGHRGAAGRLPQADRPRRPAGRRGAGRRLVGRRRRWSSCSTGATRCRPTGSTCSPRARRGRGAGGGTTPRSATATTSGPRRWSPRSGTAATACQALGQDEGRHRLRVVPRATGGPDPQERPGLGRERERLSRMASESSRRTRRPGPLDGRVHPAVRGLADVRGARRPDPEGAGADRRPARLARGAAILAGSLPRLCLRRLGREVQRPAGDDASCCWPSPCRPSSSAGRRPTGS